MPAKVCTQNRLFEILLTMTKNEDYNDFISLPFKQWNIPQNILDDIDTLYLQNSYNYVNFVQVWL